MPPSYAWKKPSPEDLATLSRLYKEFREMKRAETELRKILSVPIEKLIKERDEKVHREIGQYKQMVVEEIFRMKTKFRLVNTWSLWSHRAKAN